MYKNMSCCNFIFQESERTNVLVVIKNTKCFGSIMTGKQLFREQHMVLNDIYLFTSNKHASKKFDTSYVY